MATKTRNCFEYALVNRTCTKRVSIALISSCMCQCREPETHLPQPHDVVKLELALERNQDPSEGREGDTISLMIGSVEEAGRRTGSRRRGSGSRFSLTRWP